MNKLNFVILMFEVFGMVGLTSFLVIAFPIGIGEFRFEEGLKNLLGIVIIMNIVILGTIWFFPDKNEEGRNNG